ncbi:MAG: ROK family transcriptional regulator [Cohaesibacteraceae bacterium]|nr:ROK family transcriptional regulator [Cohaesibacteraceae bacterium]
MIEQKTLAGRYKAAKSVGHTRIYNRRLVFSALQRHQALSKAELSRETNLTPQTIANIIDDLKAARYVHETGRRSAARGQPPVVIQIEKDSGYALGLRLDVKRYDIVISDLVGQIRFRDTGLVPDGGLGELIQFTADACNAAIKKSRLPKKKFLGVGLVTPGPFDLVDPKSVSPGAVPGFQFRNIANLLKLKIRLPVLLENDAAAAVLGEQHFGQAQGVRNLFYVFLAEGVGAGILWNGEVYRGATGNAGELGHLIVYPRGRSCYCGNSGCLGQYLSIASLRAHLLENDIIIRSQSDIETLVLAGNKHVSAWLDIAADAFLLAIATVENLLEPEMIMLGGTASPELLKELGRRLNRLLPSICSRSGHPGIVLGSNLRENIAHGAATIPIIAATTPNPMVFTNGEVLSLPGMAR